MKRRPCADCRKNAAVFRKTIIDQTIVHRRQISVFVVELLEFEAALKTSLSLIGALQRQEWTPADNKSLQAIRSLLESRREPEAVAEDTVAGRTARHRREGVA